MHNSCDEINTLHDKTVTLPVDNGAIANKPNNSSTYTIGKMTFIVTPAYRKDADKSVHDFLLRLMLKDQDNH